MEWLLFMLCDADDVMLFLVILEKVKHYQRIAETTEVSHCGCDKTTDLHRSLIGW